MRANEAVKKPFHASARKLFAQMHYNASGGADFLNLPNSAVVELGSKIEI